MTAFVVDTNVAVVANDGGSTPQADRRCVLACTEELLRLRKARVCLDSGDRILAEYRQNLSLSGQPGVGDWFMMWLHQNQHNRSVCERVDITEHDERGFVEFPDDPELEKFDRSDRKFVAVALRSRLGATILNAVDSDWSHHRDALLAHGVAVKELCPDCLRES